MSAMQPHSRKSPGTSLSKMRCARHDTREAAARCAACGLPFCRECVSEYSGRLLCSACLAKIIAETKTAESTHARGLSAATLSILKRTLVVCVSACWLWLCFYLTGLLLEKVPQSVHEGTVWKQAADDAEAAK